MTFAELSNSDYYHQILYPRHYLPSLTFEVIWFSDRERAVDD